MTNEELLDRIHDLILQTPLEKLSVRAISDGCGISARYFYNHFHDKYDAAFFVYLRALDGAVFGSLQQEVVREPKPLFQKLITAQGLS
ncbi:MAG TPA: hypothetical protein DEP00_03270 [Lachnospiraceae bacterium]|jgi:AcrR family transcriptional regulator|nr:hypothetical protein [Lachnospiraceae bacterium]